MKIRELITEAKIDNAILTKWINFNPEIATTSTVRQKAKAEKKKELGAMEPDALEQTLAQMKQEGDQWEEAKKGQGDHRSKDAYKARQKKQQEKEAAANIESFKKELKGEELDDAIKEAESKIAKYANVADELKKGNRTQNREFIENNFHQRLWRARLETLNRQKEKQDNNKKIKSLAATEKSISSLLRRVKDLGLSPEASLQQVYSGISGNVDLVKNALKIWAKVEKMPDYMTTAQRDPSAVNVQNKDRTVDKVTHQGNQTLDQIERRGIEIDDNQTRAILSGMIACEVRVVSRDRKEGKEGAFGSLGVLETPLGYMYGPVEAFSAASNKKGDEILGLYAMLSMNIKKAPTDDSLGIFVNPTDVQSISQDKLVRIHHGKGATRTIDDSDSPGAILPLRLPNKGKNRPLPTDIPEVSDEDHEILDKHYRKKNFAKSGIDHLNSKETEKKKSALAARYDRRYRPNR